MAQTKVKSGLLNFPDQTDFVKLPSGTTAQRPSSPEKGYSRYNTTDNKLEYWNGAIWQQLPGVVAPIITSISYPGDDLAADPAGGQTITINGTDFKAGATVTVDGTTPSVITFVSATEITFTAPAKAAGDYDIVVTNVDGGNATAVDGMTYNGLPSWTTPAGSLGTFPAGSTIPTITLVATEPDSGVVSYSVTTGALPSGLTLTGADIDGTVPTPAGQTTYNFSVTASDDENQSTERAFNIVVYLQVTNTVSEVDPFGDSSGFVLYKLDGDATDESNTHNGNWSGTEAYVAGIFGQAADFNGSSYIDMGSTIDNPLRAAGAFGVSLWFNADSYGTNSVIFKLLNDIYVYIFLNTSNQLECRVVDSSDTSRIVAAGISLNTWYHVVWTGNSTNGVTLYINGSAVGNVSWNGTFLTYPNASYKFNYLGYNGSNTGWYNGQIDQVRVFDNILYPLEVESLYRERTVICGGQADTLDILGDNSCIATYQLNGNANDLSGNYSGTPTDVSYGVGEFDLGAIANGTSTRINTGYIQNGQVFSVSFWGRNFSAYASIIRDTPAAGGANTRINIVSNAAGGVALAGNYAVDPPTTGKTVWTHYVVTASGSVAKIYENTVEVASVSYSEAGGNNGTPVCMFSNGLYPVGFGEGELDQVRIFNKALSAGEVTTLYNETACQALACSGTTNTLDILGDGSCIAAYPLDGSPLDLSGNYNGVQTNVTYPVGKFDLSASLTKDLSTSVPSNVVRSGFAVNSSLFDGRTAMTESMWIYRENSVDPVMINGIWFNGGQRQLAINIIGSDSTSYYGDGGSVSANTVRVWFSGNVNTDIMKSFAYTAPTNEWFHFAVVFNGASTSLTFYVNGVQIGVLSDSRWTIIPNVSGNTPPTNQISFGCSPYTDVSGGNKIDQIRVFNKALSAGEVTTLYNETACN